MTSEHIDKIEQEAEELYPFDNPRKNMHHDNPGQRSRREAYKAGRLKSDEEKEKEIAELKADGERLISMKYDDEIKLRAEIERLKGLLEKQFWLARREFAEEITLHYWQEFIKENNL